MIKKLEELLELAACNEKKTLAVVAAHDKYVLEAVIKAVELGISNAILIGDEKKINQIAEKENFNLSGIDVINENNVNKCASIAVKLVSSGKAQYIMKGMINSSDILKAVLNKDENLVKEQLLSHVMIYEVETYHKLLMLSDGGMVISPGLKEKVAIINNAVKVAHRLGNSLPKVDVICAVENVNIPMSCTLDAAALSIMNKRGQIDNCIIDGL